MVQNGGRIRKPPKWPSGLVFSGSAVKVGSGPTSGVELVPAPDHGVPEPVGGDGELHRHVRVVVPLVEAAVNLGVPRVLSQHLPEHLLAHDAPQEVVDDDPLVVPAHDPLGGLEGVLAATLQARIRGDEVNHFVVELQHRQLPLADEGVLVVARITDQRGVLAVAGQIILVVVAPDEELLTAGALVVQERVVDRATTVETVQVEAGGAEVRQRVWVVLPVQAGRGIERQVMVDELPEVRVSGRNGRIVQFRGRSGHVLRHHRRDLGNSLIGRDERWKPEHPSESALRQPGHRNVPETSQLIAVPPRRTLPIPDLVRRRRPRHQLLRRPRRLELRSALVLRLVLSHGTHLPDSPRQPPDPQIAPAGCSD